MKNNQRAFTLVEALVVLMVMTIVGMMALASYQKRGLMVAHETPTRPAPEATRPGHESVVVRRVTVGTSPSGDELFFDEFTWKGHEYILGNGGVIFHSPSCPCHDDRVATGTAEAELVAGPVLQ